MAKLVIAAEPIGKRPAEVFAARLKEMRNARGGLSQAALAQRATEVGVPLSKLAVLRIEKGERGVSLDEVIALTAVLHASLAHMLSPDNGDLIALHDRAAVDGTGLRNWLRTGEPFLHATPEGHDIYAQGQFVAYARALVDASDGNDLAGVKDAMRGILETAEREKAVHAAAFPTEEVDDDAD
jgi:hypothetical protein